MSAGPEKKHKRTVTLEFTTSGVSALARVMARTDAMDLSEVLERALVFQDACMITSENGGAVILRAPNGKELTFQEAVEGHPRPS